MSDTQQIERIREALADGPVSGEWSESLLVIRSGDTVIARCSATLGKYEPEEVNARFIAACNPKAISALLARLEECERKNAELAFLLRGFLAEFGDKTCNVNVQQARAALSEQASKEQSHG